MTSWLSLGMEPHALEAAQGPERRDVRGVVAGRRNAEVELWHGVAGDMARVGECGGDLGGVRDVEEGPAGICSLNVRGLPRRLSPTGLGCRRAGAAGRAA